MNSRWRAALRDFWKSVFWIGRVPEVPDKAKKIVEALAFLFGPAVVAWVVAGIHAAWPYLSGSFGLYAAWHMAIATYRNRGPVIRFGDPEPDESWPLWDVQIESYGEGIWEPKAYVQRLRDRDEKRIPRIDEQFPAHIRGKCEGEKIELYEGKELQIVVIRVFVDGSNIIPVVWPPTPRPESGPVPAVAIPLLPGPSGG